MRRAALVVGLLVALGCSVAQAAEDPANAPDTTTSTDGRSTTDGRRTLTVSQARDLKPEVQSVTVEGAGYDNTKGIYVAFCVIPANRQSPPGPCGGGQDRTGQAGGAVWVSSNPPVYARGLTTPYGKGGTFKVSINVQAQLNAETDCRVVRCAVTTRNDHTRSSDRSQDVLIPVYFRGGFGPPAPGFSPTPTTAAAGGASRTRLTTTTTSAPPMQLAAPLATLAADGRSVRAGDKTLRASDTEELAPGSEVRVGGDGFDTRKGIYVSLCFINEQNAPGPCASGSAGQSAWISSNPPDYGKGLATPYKDGGAFEVTLTLDPVIDAAHDCKVVACALSTRNDDTHADDRSQDLLLPVSFSAAGKSVVGNLRVQEPAEDDATPLMPIGIGGALLAAATTAVVVRMRSTRS